MKKPSARTLRHPQSRKKAGRPPGSLIYIGNKQQRPIKLRCFVYDENSFNDVLLDNPEQAAALNRNGQWLWLNADGIHDPAVVEQLGKVFHIYPLVLEDILNTNSRPKLDDYAGYCFIVLKMLSFPPQANDLRVEQISLVLGSNFLLSFQEDEYDLFDPLRNRLATADSRLRKAGVDFLAYSLIDRIVDEYFVVLEQIGERIEALEEQLSSLNDSAFVNTHAELKRQTLDLRRAVWPLREVVNALLRNETRLIQPGTLPYLRDVYDHIIQVIDMAEVYRDLLGDLKDVYLSTLSLRMSQVMKMLTIIATIFIPLTFIVGVYGMNFHYMPELEWRYGYLLVWIVIVSVALSLVYYFRRRKWI
ncbi:MAG: magnesium/cobalt transporter CorA [Chitinophagales bacterium]|nr:magnesium/cobalt transporter CorA [Chitinophagales bacterium]MDW8393215.1 magnesium/cobalt transporter CorA [Chitinophagales bacterium]